MCFVWIWEQTAIISLYSINWLDFFIPKRNVWRPWAPVFPGVSYTQPATVLFLLWLRLGSTISCTVWRSVSRLGKIKAVQEGVKTFVNTFTAHKTFIQRLVRPSVSVFPVVVRWIQTRTVRGSSSPLTAVIADGSLAAVREDQNTHKECMSKWKRGKKWYKEYHRFLLSKFTAS